MKVFFKLIRLKFNVIDHIAQHVESLAQNLDYIKCTQHQIKQRSKVMPIILWFLGVPLTLIIVLWLLGVF